MLRGIPRSLDYGPHEHSCVLALVCDMAEKNGPAERRKDARHATAKLSPPGHARKVACVLRGFQIPGPTGYLSC